MALIQPEVPPPTMTTDLITVGLLRLGCWGTGSGDGMHGLVLRPLLSIRETEISQARFPFVIGGVPARRGRFVGPCEGALRGAREGARKGARKGRGSGWAADQ
ncbi:hypothetical protein GCM10009760_20200 [Kitasatospora kazusensis]|uniref:Uncharacterized protein n=1 Tax=Kitasatospora kazusensis TaxID=407974 RepID=A0ABN2Z940_9ACTN